MNNYLIKIEKFIKNKYINLYPPELKDKVVYLLQNGKRLRPILFLLFTGEDELENTTNTKNTTNTIHNTYNINDIYINYKSKSTIIYIVAIVIEILHSLSLVLDDLPEMDDDTIRRDNPSFHIKYGIDYTNFFIYYMFNHIGLELDNCNNSFFKTKKNKTKNITKQDIEINIKIISDIQTIIKQNINYLIDGQYDDLDWYSNSNSISNSNSSNVNVFLLNTSTILFLNEKDIIFELLNINNEIVNYITTIDKVNEIELNIELNIKKTSSLFNLSITSGYILQLWKNNINYLNNVKYNKIYKLLSIFSNILGYMFQISDDILDIESDKIKDKPNICSILDKDIVNKLLKNGCKWLYENAKLIHELMKQLFEKQDLKKQLLEKAAPKYSAHGLENYENNSDEECIKYDSNNYSSEDGSSEEGNNSEDGNSEDGNSDSEEVDCEEDDSVEVNSGSDIKKITFNITVINEIIGKIENRIK